MLNQVNWIDIVILTILLRTGYVGLKQGLTKHFFSFIGMIAASCLAIHYYERVAGFLTSNMNFSSGSPAILLSFILLTVGAILFFKFVIFIILRVLKVEFASFLEKSGGLIIGIFYGLVLSSLLLLIFSFSEASYVKGSLEKSYAAQWVIKIAPLTYDAILKILPIAPSEGRIRIQV